MWKSTVVSLGVLVGLTWPAHSQEEALRLEASSENGWFGYSIVSLGDLDGDGKQEIAVGEPYGKSPAGNTTGVVTIFSGGDGSVLLTIYGNGGQFGWSVDRMGDVNGDDVPDLVVGAPEFTIFNADPGYAQVISGSDGSVIHSKSGTNDRESFGSSVAGTGDVNRDGVPDFAVGVRKSPVAGQDSGAVRWFSGATGEKIFARNGSSSSMLGWCLCNVGDVNGDNVDDLLAGAPKAAQLRGEVRLYSGRTGGQIWSETGQQKYQFYGTSVAGPGDVNFDGVPDLLIGSSGNSTVKGRAELYSGKDKAFLREFARERLGNNFGELVAGPGDVDGDGAGDILVGSRWSAPGGSAWLFSGADGSVLQVFSGMTNGDNFGNSANAAGDVTGDGIPDLVIGASQEGRGDGYAVVYSGTTALRANARTIALTTGGTQTLELDAGSIHGGRDFLMIGTTEGLSASTVVQSFTVPLSPQGIYFEMMARGTSPFIQPLIGTLDAEGKGEAEFSLPSSRPGLEGLVFHHAFVVLDDKADLLFVSNPVPAILDE